MNAPEQYELTLKRFIRAPREKVFDAFTKSEALAAWHCPRGMSVAQASVDARVGGKYRVVMKGRDGMTPTAAGQYRELRRPEFLAFTWYWENGSMGPEVQTLVEVRLLEKDGGTELEFRHSGFPAAAARDGHLGGWSSVLNRLSDYLDPKGSAGTLTVFGDPRSSYTRSVRMALAEKGVAFTHVPAPPHSPEVLALNPFGRIPALKDGDTAIYETAAILRYIDEGLDGPPLRPVMLHDRTRCDQWVSLVGAHYYDAMVRRYVLQYIFPKGPNDQPDRKVIDAAIPEIEKELDVLESAYAGGDYLAGGTLSMADLLIAPILAYVEMFPEGKRLIDARPNIRRAQATIRQRPSFKATDPSAAKA
jgi:glutathione S-transferase